MTLRVGLILFLACLALALIAQRESVPITQVDIFAHAPVAPAVEAVRAAHGADRLGDDGARLTVAAPNRVRIRVAAHDPAAALRAARMLGADLVAAGLEPRAELLSRGAGSVWVLIAQLAALVPGVILAFVAAVRLWRLRRLIPHGERALTRRGAAPIG